MVKNLGLGLLTALLALGLGAPLLTLSEAALSGDSRLAATLFSEPVMRALANTLAIGGLTALLSTLCGLGLAYALQMTRAPGRAVLSWLYLAPLLAPSIMPAMGLIYLFGNNGLVFSTSLYGVPGLIAGGTLLTLPHTTLQIGLALGQLDRRQLEAAELLGASPLRRFVAVTLPQIKGALLNALLIAFVLTVTDFGVPKMLGGNVPILATEIYKYAIGLADFERAALLSLWLMVPSLVAFAGYLKYRNGCSGFAPDVDLPRHALRDRLFGLYAWFVTTVSCATIFIVVWASFLKFWPYDPVFTLDAFRFAMTPQGWLPVFNAMGLALSTAVLGTTLAWFAGLAHERPFGVRPSLARVYRWCALLPMAVPGTVLGLGFALAFAKVALFEGVWGNRLFVLLNTTLHLYTVAHLTIAGALKRLPAAYEEAGLMLGRSTAYTGRTVLAPLCKKPLWETFGLLFSGALTSISALVFLYAPTSLTGAVAALLSIDAGYLNEGAAMASVLFGINMTVRAALLGLSKR